MKYSRLWERLLEFLNEWSTAVEVGPGRIEVVLQDMDGSTRAVEVLMTRDQWDELVTVPWGDFQTAAQGLRKSALGLRGDERFLVYRQYELVPSETPILPIEAEEPDVLTQHPDGQFRWSAIDPGRSEGDREPPP